MMEAAWVTWPKLSDSGGRRDTSLKTSNYEEGEEGEELEEERKGRRVKGGGGLRESGDEERAAA